MGPIIELLDWRKLVLGFRGLRRCRGVAMAEEGGRAGRRRLVALKLISTAGLAGHRAHDDEVVGACQARWQRASRWIVGNALGSGGSCARPRASGPTATRLNSGFNSLTLTPRAHEVSPKSNYESGRIGKTNDINVVCKMYCESSLSQF